MSEHTLAPWKYDELTAKVWDADDMPVCIPTLNHGVGGREANARLIAAAPELLAALQVMVDASRESDLTALANRIDRARQTAEDVIKKVCGQ